MFIKPANKVKANAPEILLVAGVGLVIYGTVKACQASRKLDDILDEHKEAMEAIHSDNTLDRLTQFSHTDDGFEIAELDLQTRGAGNLEGNEQSGSWVFRWFDWIADQELIAQTLQMAETILKDKDSFSEEAREKIQLWYSEKKSANEDGVH